MVGAVANLLGLIVLLQPVFRNKSTFVYLSALAITDTAVLVWLPIHMTVWGTQPPVLATALLVYLQQCSSSLLVAVTIDRCIIVFHPLRSRTFCTRRRALIVMLVFYILVPLPQLLGLTCIDKYQIPETCFKIQAYIYVSMYAFIPFLILLVANISIIVRLRRRACELGDMTNAETLTSDLSPTEESTEMSVAEKGDRRIATMSAAERDDRKITIMLICTTLWFFILVTPVSLSRVINILPYEKLYENSSLEILVDIGLVNHAINMFIYCSTGRKFREEASSVAARLATRVRVWFVYASARLANRVRVWFINASARLASRVRGWSICPSNNNTTSSVVLIRIQPIEHGFINQSTPLQFTEQELTPEQAV